MTVMPRSPDPEMYPAIVYSSALGALMNQKVVQASGSRDVESLLVLDRLALCLAE
jgi:hypothetical protein